MTATQKNRSPRTPVRVTGLVKIMNTARQRIAEGIDPANEPEFRQWVADAIDAIDQICQKTGIDTSQLSTPTYRAYLELKNILTMELPRSEPASAGGRPRAIRMTRVVANANSFRERLADLANQLHQAGWRGGNIPRNLRKRFEDLRDSLTEHTQVIQEAASSIDSTPEMLPEPSRRAFRWLSFLSEEENLLQHLEALEMAVRVCAHPRCSSPKRKDLPPLQVEFYHIPAIYKSRMVDGVYTITASEGFIAAPEDMLRGLVCAALYAKEKQYVDRLRDWVDESPEFSEVMLALEVNENANEASRRGRTHDLDEVFERVNQAYFQGQMERPRLVWNRTLTNRKMGHYHPATDTVMISISLDNPNVPPYLVDFIMYHELLHKALGVQRYNGRRFVHTPEFRAAERHFRQYEMAQKLLNIPAAEWAQPAQTLPTSPKKRPGPARPAKKKKKGLRG